jgi:hypothetical protein
MIDAMLARVWPWGHRRRGRRGGGGGMMGALAAGRRAAGRAAAGGRPRGPDPRGSRGPRWRAARSDHCSARCARRSGGVAS